LIPKSSAGDNRHLLLFKQLLCEFQGV